MVRKEKLKFIVKWFICWLQKNRKWETFPNDYSPVKVNLGAGKVVAERWINIDSGVTVLMATIPNWILKIGKNISTTKMERQWMDTIMQLKEKRCYFIHYDLNYGIPLPKDFANFIYSSHLFEHFPCAKGNILLKECYRVLKSGGVLRVCVPDLEKLVNLYLKGERIRFLAAFFSDLRGVDEYYGKHRFMYDYSLLHKAMADAGFKKIVLCNYQQGAVPDLKVLEVQSDVTLYVEAIK